MKKNALDLSVIVLSIALVLAPAAAMAQEASPAAGTASAAAPPKNLGEALPNLRWDPAERGPLLIVAPQAAAPAKPPKNTATDPLGEPAAPPPAAPPPSLVNGVYRQSDLLEYFGCRIVRLKGVTVFAPAEMTLLNSNPGKPDIYSRLRLRDKLQMLEATLTPAQWQKISSPAGLGIGDTEGEQRALFDSMLPNPFVYQITTTTPSVDASGKPEPPVRRPASAAQRSGISLRIYRETQLRVPSIDTSSPWSFASLTKNDPDPVRLSVYETENAAENSAYGVTLTQQVPSRLKAGQIDFDSTVLNTSIALADTATVGDLIDRIRLVTRLELYADRRLARLPLYINAAPDARLRAGDALKALCWGVTGAVRYVSNSQGAEAGQGVFLLTDDIEGLGSRLGRISEWSESAFSGEYDAKRRLDKAIRAKNALQHIGFAPDEVFRPTPEQMSAIEKSWGNTTLRVLGAAFPVDVLPPDLQERVRRRAHETNAARARSSEEDRQPPVSDNSVLVSVRLGLRLEVPNVGSISYNLGSYGGLSSFLPPAEYSAPGDETLSKQITLPPNLKAGGVLCVTPADEEEARSAVRAARAKGLRQVWIATPRDRDEDTDFLRTLAAAIQEAREPGAKLIDVLAVARVLSVPRRNAEAKDDTSEPKPALDVTIEGLPETAAIRNRLTIALQAGEEMKDWETIAGETRDWLVPDAPGVTSRIVERLRKLAETPGLGGVVLTDLLAPGYRVPKGVDENQSDENTQPSLGYTASRRIAAIRNIGYDPIDLSLGSGWLFSDIPQPPFFSESFQQSLLKDSYKAPEQMKALGAAVEKDNLQALAEVAPSMAWNRLRFRAAGELVHKLFTSLSDMAKGHPTSFRVYLQSMTNSDGGEWFGSWDLPDRLPIMQGIQGEENYMVRLERSARAASKTILYSHSFQPGDQVPLPPVEKFAVDFNRILREARRSWDGYVFDLRDLPTVKALDLLQGVTPIATPVIMSPSGALDAPRVRRR